MTIPPASERIVVCPFCGSKDLYPMPTGITIMPELGLDCFGCINCRGLFNRQQAEYYNQQEQQP